MFPIYYFDQGDVLLVGTSPSPFRRHPRFRTAVDPVGLAGNLLLMHSLHGRILFEGVRRLDAGNVLVKQPGGAATEHAAYRVPESDTYFDHSYPALVEIARVALGEAVARHAGPHRAPTMMLSGGIDSRLVAAHVRRLGHDAIAFTQGVPADLEMQCARAVATRLGMPHRSADVPPSEYPDHALRAIRAESLSNGFSGIHNWGIVPFLNTLPFPIVSGYVMDPLYSPADPAWGRSATSGTVTFEDVFRTRVTWGIAPPALKQLLRPDKFAGIVDDVMTELARSYESLGERASFKAWMFLYRNKARLHAGGHLWPHTFTNWPVVPAADRALLATMAGFPQAALHNRNIESDVLLADFPSLADVPLDRNGPYPAPIRPRLPWKIQNRAIRGRDSLRRRILRRPPPDRRYYGRVYDFNGPEWVAIRRRAEPLRERAYEFFDRAEFDRLLPAPDVRIPFRDVISESSVRKNLIGFLLWLEQNS